MSTGGSEIQVYGLGVVQEIDAAAMSIWLHYRHLEGEINGIGSNAAVAGYTGDGSETFEDLDMLKFGALINF